MANKEQLAILERGAVGGVNGAWKIATALLTSLELRLQEQI